MAGDRGTARRGSGGRRLTGARPVDRRRGTVRAGTPAVHVLAAAGAAGPIAAAPGEATIQRSQAAGARQGSVPSQAAAEPSAPPARGGAPGLEPDATDASVASFDESKYQAAVAELERVLRDHRDKLDPATVQILEHNLAIIDRAIAEARSALLADPANPYLNGHLAQQLKRKIWLLQRVTDVVAAHG